MNKSKYKLYELAVQSTVTQVEIFQTIYQELKNKPARKFREDFCGTFVLSAEWVKSNFQNSALAIDLDPIPLKYGKSVHYTKLRPDQKKRLVVKKQNVLKVTSQKSQLIGACNFSFYIFKDRKILVNYFKSCLRSLEKDGILVLEMVGGPGMIESKKEQKTVKTAKGEKFKYVWHQKSFNPIDQNGKYAIHFLFKKGKPMMDAFTYDWRIWTIPEVCEALEEAGFKKTVVYYDKSKSNDHSNYVLVEKAPNDHAWIAQIVGIK